jgi:hypothetical protein
MTMKKTSITSRQKKQYNVFVHEAARKGLAQLKLDSQRLQKLFSNGGDFQKDIIASIEKHSVCNQFSGEVTSSSYEYPKEFKLKTLEEQDQILHTFFPGLGSTDLKPADHKLPNDAEAYFLIPRWEKIAPTYNQAVEKVLELIASKRDFQNYRKGELGPDRLQEGSKKTSMMKIIGRKQKSDILVVPAQLGMKYRGSSVRRAREIFGKNEFGFGAFEVGIIALTHPDRFVRFDELDTDCPGDEYAPGAGRVFSKAPLFLFFDGKLRFGTSGVSVVFDRYGSVSGFVPQ